MNFVGGTEKEVYEDLVELCGEESFNLLRVPMLAKDVASTCILMVVI